MFSRCKKREKLIDYEYFNSLLLVRSQYEAKPNWNEFLLLQEKAITR